MSILRLVIFIMAATVFAGTLVLAALIAPVGLNNATGMIGSAVVGVALAIPVAIVVSNKIGGNMAG